MIDTPHRRFNPLTRDWVLVSPHRARRPWLGQVEKTPSENLPQYDPACYLCPGNERAGGIKNPPYTGTFVFDNDFAALLPDAAEAESRPVPPVACIQPRAWPVPGGVFLAPPRPDPARVGEPRHRECAGSLDAGKCRPGRKGFYPLRTGLRKQGRPDGLFEPASAQPDLGAVPAAQ